MNAGPNEQQKKLLKDAVCGCFTAVKQLHQIPEPDVQIQENVSEIIETVGLVATNILGAF